MINDIVTAGTGLAIANKVLGKTADAIATDLATIYTVGRDKILQVAARKIKNENKNQIANLRVARDVFLNGSFTDESICAEYFGGILAASRSKDGKDDTGIFYVDIIKSLSSNQLHLHYVVYKSLNRLLLQDNSRKNINCASQREMPDIIFSTLELQSLFGKDRLTPDLFALNTKGLFYTIAADLLKLDDGQDLPYATITPSPLGIQLFAIANNEMHLWQKFSQNDFGEFKDISLPQHAYFSINSLKEFAIQQNSQSGENIS